MLAPTTTIEDRISEHYADLSTKLRTAADYVANNPVDVATRSLRSVAHTSGVSPATFSRLARMLGFEDYEEMREAGRVAVGRKLVPFSERARSLRQSGQSQRADEFLHHQAKACVSNITFLDQNISGERLDAAVTALHRAKNVLLIGSMGSSGFVDYFGYQAQWFKSNWSIAGRNGVTAAAALARMEADDAIFVLSKSPYARRSILALQEARRKRLKTVVVTDSHSSPALQFADHFFVVPTETPNFFSSYAATLVLMETMMSLLLMKAGSGAESRVKDTEAHVERLGENWS